MKDKETKDWYKVEIRELIRKNLSKIHRKVGDSYGIDVSFLHKVISEYTEQELDKAREEGFFDETELLYLMMLLQNDNAKGGDTERPNKTAKEKISKLLKQ